MHTMITYRVKTCGALRCLQQWRVVRLGWRTFGPGVSDGHCSSTEKLTNPVGVRFVVCGSVGQYLGRGIVHRCALSVFKRHFLGEV